MRKIKKLVALLATVCMLTAGLIAPMAGAAEGEPFVMSVNLASEPQTIDSALNSSVDGAIMLHHFFEGLMSWEDDGNGNATLVNGQITGYEAVTNDDGTVTCTFTLRDDIKWSDGQDVVAADFVFGLQRLLDPATAGEYAYILDGIIVNATEVMAGEVAPTDLAVRAIDEKTLEIILCNECPYFLELLAFPPLFPVRQDIIEAHGDQWTFDPATYVSNGPYKMQEWVHNSYISAVKNENYYDFELLGPDEIRFVLMDDANAMLAGFRSGELDFIEEMPVDEIPTLLANDELHIVDYIGTYYVCYQTQKAPFDDPLVREAFTLAIDREYIVDNITRTGQVPAGGYVPAGIYDAQGTAGDDFRTVGGDYYSVSAEDYAANCERARELLAEAGYPNGEGFPVVEYLYNTNDNHKAIGEALQNMWGAELGVTVTLNNQDWAVFLDTRKNGDYSIARNGWIADFNDPISFIDMWVTGAGNNDAQYENPDYDALVAQSRALTDPAERFKVLHEAEDVLLNDFVVGPIYFYTNKYMLNEEISGLYYTPLGYFLFDRCTKG